MTAVATLALPEALDASTVGPLCESLRAARGAPLALDASRVRRLGGQGAQALLSAAATWRLDRQRLSVAAPSAEFVEGLRVMGLSLDSVAAGAA